MICLKSDEARPGTVGQLCVACLLRCSCLAYAMWTPAVLRCGHLPSCHMQF